MVYFYAIFIAGYFLLPMAGGHRKLYYILVLPAALLLWRELLAFYQRNLLAWLVLAYVLYMLATLAWSSNCDVCWNGIGCTGIPAIPGFFQNI